MPKKVALLIGLASILFGLVWLTRTPRYNNLFLEASNFKDLSLAGQQRLLVLAPHCDDEVLGAAGVISAALRQGIDVRVVIATNGDGYLFATMEDFRRLFPHHADFIRMGNLRQQESLQALGVLGVPPEKVIFLSYPDRGLHALWSEFWSASDPFRSPYSNQTSSPYALTYNRSSVYAGEDLLADLRSILDSYQPDLIIYSHPEDVHPDHWGLSAFTRLALSMEQYDNPEVHPATFAYLVHRHDFPEPKGLHPQESLLPPPTLFVLDPGWFTLSLGERDILTKQNAILQYRSQLPLLRELLESFVRVNELFSHPDFSTLPSLNEGDLSNPDTWRDSQGNKIQPVQRDPTRDLFYRTILPAADLVGVYAAKARQSGLDIDGQDQLVVCAKVRGKANSRFIYDLRVKAVGPDGIIDHVARNHTNHADWHHPTLSGNVVCDQISWMELGKPWEIVVGVNVEEVGAGVLDQVAWQFLVVNP